LLTQQISNKKLSCRKETVRLLCESVLVKYNWTFCGHYRSIFNHYPQLACKAIEFGYYAVQGHSRSSMSVPSPHATSC